MKSYDEVMKKKKNSVTHNGSIFSTPGIVDLCESIMEIDRALKTIGMIFNEFDFEKDNGNAFQGRIQKTWFKSVINEMVQTQLEKAEQIIAIYSQEQKKL